jgi:hypothetical protein
MLEVVAVRECELDKVVMQRSHDGMENFAIPFPYGLSFSVSKGTLLT